MIGFWFAAGLLAAAAAVLILHRARAAAVATPDDPTLAVYRRQLAEIDDLAARGVLAEPERKSAYAEAGRRLLAAADQGARAWTATPPRGGVLLAAAAAGPLLALALYLAVGAPGFPDQPIAARIAAWRSASPESLQPAEMAAVLRGMVAERPGDPQALQYLAMAEAASGDPASAARALRRAIELEPNRAVLWESLGEALVMQAGGEISTAAQSAFKEALRRDPKSVTARVFLAKQQVDSGDRALGLAQWRAVQAELPAEDPRREALARVIAEAEGAPAADDQQAMIRGMVDSLAARLEQSPDDPDGWVRLVRSYAVLGDAVSRDRALASAKARYRGRADILEALDEAAAADPMP
ncbi:c-type cytochrome biogenesis protein CcmI [Phenylobacterium sp.]|jgi:cytochrome c-type biogenesis protein CcmH|uniref:c-type cytochrome biogenesis protein CcmI n=1 Tax=Phenylobacterium sp. TaxID=1871053 RepID=UPI002E2F1618|nr:c-type cytochrome biogenesis protein CcmI [Phenylobacterium sp.]HEX2561863.1 c-type cytochrome biogenesis protein CcmI [Phenylobacterium sp.]